MVIPATSAKKSKKAKSATKSKKKTGRTAAAKKPAVKKAGAKKAPKKAASKKAATKKPSAKKAATKKPSAMKAATKKAAAKKAAAKKSTAKKAAPKKKSASKKAAAAKTAAKKATPRKKAATKSERAARRVTSPAPEAPKTPSSRSVEARLVARQLAAIAVTRVKQDGQLSVRQREQLRRALAKAAEFEGWAAVAAHDGDPVKKLTKDVTKLTKRGTTTISTELADELAGKRTEMSQLAKAAKSIRKLAEADESVYPAEVSYSHTARDAAEGLVTKTEELTLNDATEAADAAQVIEKRMESWGKLREQMILDIKQKQKRLDEMKNNMPNFVESTRRLLVEVLATLH